MALDIVEFPLCLPKSKNQNGLPKQKKERLYLDDLAELASCNGDLLYGLKPHARLGLRKNGRNIDR